MQKLTAHPPGEGAVQIIRWNAMLIPASILPSWLLLLLPIQRGGQGQMRGLPSLPFRPVPMGHAVSRYDFLPNHSRRCLLSRGRPLSLSSLHTVHSPHARLPSPRRRRSAAEGANEFRPIRRRVLTRRAPDSEPFCGVLLGGPIAVLRFPARLGRALIPASL
jgi:hypothetical protein